MEEIKFVWMVDVDWAQEGETGHDSWLFFNEEDARQKFEKEIQSAEIDYDREDYIRERNEYYYEVYEEGEWLITHCAVSLVQKSIL